MALEEIEQQQMFLNLRRLMLRQLNYDSLIGQCEKNLSLICLELAKMREREKEEGKWE
jgi:hypothetical protein